MWYIVNAERFNKRQFEVGDSVEVELVKSDADEPGRATICTGPNCQRQAIGDRKAG